MCTTFKGVIVAGCRTHLDNSNYRDIILSGNAHYSSLEPFSVGRQRGARRYSNFP